MSLIFSETLGFPIERFKNGHLRHSLKLNDQIKELILERNYSNLDRVMGEYLRPGGILHNFLYEIFPFKHSEYILALRDEGDLEDGIWHDDGSRLFAFSLSLCLEPESIRGGALEIRKKGETEIHSLGPLAFGEMIVFLTGQFGFEHRTRRVWSGKRLVCAGWMSLES